MLPLHRSVTCEISKSSRQTERNPLTKKDYEAFAEMFADVETNLVQPIRSEKSRAVARTVARHIQTRAADIFADDNPRFSRARFFAACTRAEREREGYDDYVIYDNVARIWTSNGSTSRTEEPS